MTVVISTVFSVFWNLVFALCTTLVLTFIALAYFAPMQLDMLVHQAHDVVPATIDSIARHITNLFNKII